ncbi:Rrf2 family transcriptional regulator [Ligilactobacillus ceti]|uniref:Rrf2 family transcriptional regulator n=1 Tax=Ligilactobacillus ceti DSM 22408 TaxID=1122146 RepID=A0A0R2KJN6_9LACO|nr:Rrf2 family transcriptional regulator [Ligilactobacillus ceti]KRN89577.1 Rrf2 family transcriptional regulator [Ligilactobacillus ceti DSM 22408]
MQLTKGFEQAACIMVLLTTQRRDIPLSSRVIHQRIKGSHTYLHKIMRKLVVADLITSTAGLRGGFQLAHAPSEITLLDVVHATAGKVKTYPGFGFIEQVFQEFQPYSQDGVLLMEQAFADADRQWENSLAQVTLEQLLCDIFQVKQITPIDWNQVEPVKEKSFIENLKTNLHNESKSE